MIEAITPADDSIKAAVDLLLGQRTIEAEIVRLRGGAIALIGIGGLTDIASINKPACSIGGKAIAINFGDAVHRKVIKARSRTPCIIRIPVGHADKAKVGQCIIGHHIDKAMVDKEQNQITFAAYPQVIKPSATVNCIAKAEGVVVVPSQVSPTALVEQLQRVGLIRRIDPEGIEPAVIVNGLVIQTKDQAIDAAVVQRILDGVALIDASCLGCRRGTVDTDIIEG